MRRVYYFEFDHLTDRRKELQQTLLLAYEDSLRKADENRGRPKTAKRDPVTDREPWIPHPETKETVPGVALYSVLVGGLPSAPHHEVDDVERAVGASKSQRIDWQLTFCGEYFDKCVPNQPGYSSSVAAITVLPSASDLASAWSKWYNAASKLRRLRFIRRLIQEKLHYDVYLDEDDDEVELRDNQALDADRKELPQSTDSPLPLSTVLSSGDALSQPRSASEIYKDTDANHEYYRHVFGSGYGDAADESGVFQSSYEFGGPEQTAVYSREFAQSAAACCPHGCGEGRLRRSGIDELRRLEEEAKQEVHAANLLLRKAQARAVVSSECKELLNEEKKYISNEKSTKQLPTHESMDSAGSTPHDIFRAVHLHRPGSIRQRTTSRSSASETGEWAVVDSIVSDPAYDGLKLRGSKGYNSALMGVAKWPSPRDICGVATGEPERTLDSGTDTPKHLASNVLDTLTRETTYAVVTFTSRQAAVAARQCLADGRAFERWTTFEEVPVPPLSDAAAFQLCPCRGCCRPVTISINNRQKLLRRNLAYLLLGTIYFFYTIPLTFATSLVDPSRLQEVFPRYEEWIQEHGELAEYLTGIVPALIWTAFFALCPVMFKTIANFGSSATSVYAAEYKSLQYYWWFMALTAFSGTSLSTMILSGFNEGIRIGSEAQEVLLEIANSIPLQLSAAWIGWITVRTLITLPLNYMLQVNTYLFHWLGWNCCSRLVRGGGPGGPTPYRILIDSGVVFLCVVALAPAAPMLAPFAMVYYLYAIPLWRRNLIFMYRPKYDSGGRHWPFLFDMLVSCLLIGQILLTTMMALKRAVAPAVLAALPLLAILMFRQVSRDRFLRGYLDTSLYTSSQLDGWDVHEETSMEKREEFRKFLVDCHKAAYVPCCLAAAGSDQVMTAEPAVVVRLEHDADMGESDALHYSSAESLHPRAKEPNLSWGSIPLARQNSTGQGNGLRVRANSQVSQDSIGSRSQGQFGASLRRVPVTQRHLVANHAQVLNHDDGSVSLKTTNYAGTILSVPQSTMLGDLVLDEEDEDLESIELTAQGE